MIGYSVYFGVYTTIFPEVLGVGVFVGGIGSFFVLCPALPVPLVRCKSNLLPYRRGGCSPDAKQPKEQQEETALCTVFSSCPYGERLIFSLLRIVLLIIYNDLPIAYKTKHLFYRMLVL
jgi:hypothetical protein